jgi:hypothetical protein
MILSPTTEAFQQEDQSWLGSAHGTDATVSITLDTSAFTANTHYPNGYFISGIPLGKIAASGLYGPYAGSPSEVQTATITGTPTGGTFTLTYDGATTSAIAYNATAATVQTALEALSTVRPGELSVSGSAGGPYTVTFTGENVGDNTPAMTASGASLTGGTSPGVTIATTTGGGPAASDGSEVLAGFLFCSVKAPSVNTIDVPAAMLDHGKVRTAKLPIAVDAAGQERVRGRIRFI